MKYYKFIEYNIECFLDDESWSTSYKIEITKAKSSGDG